MFERSSRLCAALLAGLSIATLAHAAGPDSRAEAVKIIADMRRIVTPQGIEQTRAVRIGGIDQWISVRGTDRRNPVLLFLHGGPGYVAMPTSWYFQRGWEEYFTVVQWDQRGAGKTYAANDPAQIAPTMTRARMLAEAEEMVAFLRKEFGKDRIFVLGHSWGSSLGIQLAQRHPDWLHAYVGIGQVTDAMESERRGWQYTMEAARKAEAALMGGGRIGRLHGVPVTIKDLAITKDMPTQNGSLIFKGNQPAEDTPVVPRLQDEGAIILGKTTTSEFGWTGVSHSPLTGITHNPWKHGMNAGASSAGAGAWAETTISTRPVATASIRAWRSSSCRSGGSTLQKVR